MVLLMLLALIFQGDSQSNDPVAYDNGVTYMFVQHSNIYLMIASRQNCNAASLISFLHRVVDVSFPWYSIFFFAKRTLNCFELITDHLRVY